ncbi:MAG TPA: hypothetical protein VIY68_08515 [Steroidobacteraceae bacterium]
MDPKGAMFDPELIELIKSVFDDATAMLPESKRTSSIKAEMASSILACAAMGERNRTALKTQALKVAEVRLPFLNRERVHRARRPPQ